MLLAANRPRTVAFVILLLGASVAVVAAGFYERGSDEAPEVTASPQIESLSSSPDLFTVHVSGAVTHPGLVALVDGSRVADAIAAAGGASAAADLGSVNLAALVTDGSQLRIPWAGDAGSSSGVLGVAGDGRIDLNRAAAADLQALPGVGEVLAGRIVAHREAHGPFAAVEDLLDVSGIGERKLADIRLVASVG